MLENKKFLNSNAIKLIAIIAMTIDHIAWAVYPGYSTEPGAIVMHIIGRITCPIMCYCIAEGFHYTHDVKKYTLRLLIFALISHVPYMLQSSAFFEFGALALVPFATGGSVMGHILNQTSVMWSLAIGLIMLRVNYSENIKQSVKPFLIFLLCIAAFPADWSCIASLCVFAIGTNRGKPLSHVRDLRAYTICLLARHPRSRLLQRSARQESDCKQSYEMGVLHILSVAPSRDCVDTHFCVIYRL